jgi:hypothetical protein
MSNQKQEFCKKLYETKESTDLVITFNGIPYHVHAIVLGMTLRYFRDSFLSTERDQSMDIELEIPFISQDAFEHFLKYTYGWELDMDNFLPLFYLSEHFQCKTLSKMCRKNRLYKLSFSESNALQFFQCTSKLTLDETKQVTENTFLVDCVVWFTVHFDKILELKLETLKLIPLEWLRYVFGSAPFHVFESELDRLDKARQLYLKWGESTELYSALFEGIRFNCIPLRDMCGEKYMFLYQVDNDIVLDKLQGSRISDMSGKYNEEYLRENPSFVMKVGTKVSMAHNVRAKLILCGDEKPYRVLELKMFLWPMEHLQYSDCSLNAFLFFIQDNLQRWDFCSEHHSKGFMGGVREKTSLYIHFPRSIPDARKMRIRVNVMSLSLKYTQ